MSRNMPDPITTANGKTICGAPTKSGGICQQRPMSNGTGNGRCRFHGGKTLDDKITEAVKEQSLDPSQDKSLELMGEQTPDTVRGSGGGSDNGSGGGIDNGSDSKSGDWSRFLSTEDEAFLALPMAERMARLQAVAELGALRAYAAKADCATDKLPALDMVFARNARIVAALAQTRIRLADSPIERDQTGEEAQSSVQRIRGVVGVLKRARDRRTGHNPGPPAVEPGEPTAD